MSAAAVVATWAGLPFTASTHLVVCVEEGCEYTRWADGSPRGDDHVIATDHQVAVFRFEGELTRPTAAAPVVAGKVPLPAGRKRAFRHQFRRQVGKGIVACVVPGCSVEMRKQETATGREDVYHRLAGSDAWRAAGIPCVQVGRS